MTIRLTIIAAVLYLACLPAFAAPAAPAARSEARVALENTIDQVMAEMKKPAMQNPSTRPAVLASIEKVIKTLFDFEGLSMRTVGPKWKDFSPEQKADFMTAFESLLRERYINSLGAYDGEKVSYTGETTSTNGERVEIRTVVESDGKAVPVAYRMQKTDRWQAYDMIIEGVSLVQNYRSQFQAILDKGDADTLIGMIRQKAEEVAVNKTGS
jgi:phospholipid transport system substrate-binding protein